MNRIRMASLCLVGTLVFTSLPVYGQGGPPAGTPGADANLNARVAVLEELVTILQGALNAQDLRVRKLESGAVTEADMVGTFAINSLGMEMLGNQPGVIGPRIRTEAGGGTLTLNANRTVSASIASSGGCTIQGFGWLVTCVNDSGSADPIPGVAWTVDNGKLVLTEEGDEDAEFLIGAGGRVLIGGGISTDTPNHSWGDIVLLVRLPNP